MNINHKDVKDIITGVLEKLVSDELPEQACLWWDAPCTDYPCIDGGDPVCKCGDSGLEADIGCS